MLYRLRRLGVANVGTNWFPASSVKFSDIHSPISSFRAYPYSSSCVRPLKDLVHRSIDVSLRFVIVPMAKSVTIFSVAVNLVRYIRGGTSIPVDSGRKFKDSEVGIGVPSVRTVGISIPSATMSFGSPDVGLAKKDENRSIADGL
ncbi:hypothetical protein ABW21_db0204902 [Orbilia brochopaga]|nr:hypothetical protein ABW21_db0204902 [Drechslerella brochopaga]